MNTTPLAQANQEMPSRESLGSQLRTARQNRNTSLAEAAGATRISQRVLTALEANDFAALPAEVFTRGFIKIYAEYLGLDSSEVLKLFTDQENLDPERPADRPYRNDILHGKVMAQPLQLFKGNPRLRIIVLLLVALLSFYALGAIFKSLQKRPVQNAPENEVAQSLVDSQPQALQVPPGEEVQPAPVPAGQEPAEAPAISSLQPDPQTNPVPTAAPLQNQTGGTEQNIAAQSQATPTYPRISATGSTNQRASAGGESAQQLPPLQAAAPATLPGADSNRPAPRAATPR